MSKTADLHIHTTFSDSTLSPEQVIKYAHESNIDCVAITDHDTTAGIDLAIKAAEEYGIEVIPGVELSCEANGKDIHMLGYLFDYKDEELLEQFACMQDTRVGRMKKMIEKLKELGIDNIDLKEVRDLAQSQSLGRPHLAAILKEKGWISSIREAFDKYIADGGPAYVAKYKQSPEEAIKLIKKAGGVAVLAHPMITKVDELIPSFVSAGLGGIEAYYPNNSKTICEFYANLASKNGMVATGGSDAHGGAKYNTYIGKLTVPYDIVDKLKSRVNR